MALIQITDAGGQQWQYDLSPQTPCTIGRAPDNCVTLNDPRASRYHAHIKHEAGAYFIVDGFVSGAGIKRSANQVLVNGQPHAEHRLTDGDQITIGTSRLTFVEPVVERVTAALRYEEGRLGRTQITVSAYDLVRQATRAQATTDAPNEELVALRRKADVLALIYELSRTLGSVFDLDTIFGKATEIIFRITPADRVVALLRDGHAEGADEEADLRPVAAQLRHEKLGQTDAMHISRTITNKVLHERVALLTQDAAADAQFSGSDSIVSQGVRSTICAPLVTESGVHGVLYADRLDPFARFTRDDLELITAIAAQTAVTVETVRSHERLAREEVARANYSRFMPDYVVRQILENPESFKLGGVNQIVTVLFADVRGFTLMAESTPPEQVVRLLNRYFSVMTEIIFSYGGTLDKYIGDGLMALFGAPTASPSDATNAVTTAVVMQQQLRRINADLQGAGLQEIAIGIGLHTGVATVGYIGSERRTEYTAIGDTVNLAARLEQNAAGGQILVSAAVSRAAQCTYPLKQHVPLTVKNRVQPVQVYEVDWQQA